MLALAFRFPAGSYHATPWGHHINEASIAWPPESFRLIRALLAVWFRKMQGEAHEYDEFKRLLEKLASNPPCYYLPEGVQAHTKHYMPVIEGRNEKNKLIFDAFLRLDRDEELVVAWPELEVGETSLELLDSLLSRIGYLGRAESWVEASVMDDWGGEFNCVPSTDNFDPETGEITGEIISLLHPLTPDAYARLRDRTMKEIGGRDLKPAQVKKIKASLPEDWLDAIAVETSVIQAAGWSDPPAARKVEYSRPMAVMKTSAIPKVVVNEQASYSTARFSIYGKPLPRIEDSLRVGEWLRQAVMGRARRLLGEEKLPRLLSGHELGKENRHEHAFYLPEDADGDGRIDHLVVHVPAGMDIDSQRVIGELTRIWRREGDEYLLLLEGIANADDFEGTSKLFNKSPTHLSITPYLHPWHVKKKFTVEDQIRKECSMRGLPELKKLERIKTVKVGGRPLYPLHFHRFRSKRGLTQPDRQGSFWRLTFSEPVRGPIALGFACHFGLGLFAAE